MLCAAESEPHPARGESLSEERTGKGEKARDGLLIFSNMR